MADRFDVSSLDKLNPEVRSKVEAALKSTLERELAATAATPDLAAAHSRSKGAIFSRSRTSDLLARDDIESLVSRNIETLDDSSFDKFTKRLGALRNIKGAG